MTLIEVLVVVTILTLLMAMLFPALNSARESSRSTACQMNLKQIGVGLSAYATLHGTLGSGAFDWRNDGCVTERGWVANLVAQGTPVGKMLCPSNPAQISQTFNDLAGMDTTVLDSCVDFVGSPPEIAPDGQPISNPCRAMVDGKMPAGSTQRCFLVETQIYNKHYNTNYTPSWFLVRGGVRLDSNGRLLSNNPAGCPVDSSALNKALLSLHCTQGPLLRAAADTAAVSSSFLPLMGCGSPNGTLTVPIASLMGKPAVPTMTAGPVLKTNVANMGTAFQPPWPPAGTPYGTSAGWWAVWTKQTLQDYRNFGPVHRGSCNILFADGGVRNVLDANQDGMLNNGFLQASNGGFASDTVELPPDEFFSCYSLKTKPVTQ